MPGYGAYEKVEVVVNGSDEPAEGGKRKRTLLTYLLSVTFGGLVLLSFVFGGTGFVSEKAAGPCLVLSINLIHCGNEFRNSVPVRTLGL